MEETDPGIDRTACLAAIATWLDEPDDEPDDGRVSERMWTCIGTLGFRYARRFLGDRDRAMDATSEAFVAMVRCHGKIRFADPTHVLAHFFAILRKKCFNELRLAGKFPAANESAQESMASNRWLTPPDRLSQLEVVSRVQAAIARLPEREKEAVRWHKIEGRKHKEIAEIMGENLENVRQLVCRGLKQLAKLLAEFDPNRRE